MPNPSGWLSGVEAAALKVLAADRTVIEIGAWQGLSTRAIARTAKHVLTVDWWLGDAYTEAVAGKKERSELLTKWAENTAEIEHVTPIVGDMHQSLSFLRPAAFQFMFYDADHDPDPTIAALNWFSIQGRDQKPWAIAVHDYKPRIAKYKATNQAIDQWAEENGLTMQRAGSLAIFQGGQDARRLPDADV